MSLLETLQLLLFCCCSAAVLLLLLMLDAARFADCFCL